MFGEPYENKENIKKKKQQKRTRVNQMWKVWREAKTIGKKEARRLEKRVPAARKNVKQNQTCNKTTPGTLFPPLPPLPPLPHSPPKTLNP